MFIFVSKKTTVRARNARETEQGRLKPIIKDALHQTGWRSRGKKSRETFQKLQWCKQKHQVFWVHDTDCLSNLPWLWAHVQELQVHSYWSGRKLMFSAYDLSYVTSDITFESSLGLLCSLSDMTSDAREDRNMLTAVILCPRKIGWYMSPSLEDRYDKDDDKDTTMMMVMMPEKQEAHERRET
jgi:hypothetical protein